MLARSSETTTPPYLLSASNAPTESKKLRSDSASRLALIDAADSPEKLINRIAPWLEREFEQTREAALKSIRTERKLLEISFDATHPGPFA